jgi:hypothetical protein
METAKPHMWMRSQTSAENRRRGNLHWVASGPLRPGQRMESLRTLGSVRGT